ncbi:Replication factor A protein 3 [Ascosphaera apis ARSEF 7405]|uniref:Replication factor A protein 3 n=1 Tax=Ascosphaera apis ARSEF 7405 TaxID=392613 RepID=A0A167UXZ2_9EURO|nr:Replication factor A protein 3 [Ascosphaera apis ARSEF 7405]
MSLSTPRILPEHLHNFTSSNRSTPNTVRILGTVSSVRGEHATISCGSHGDVTVVLNRDTHIQVGRVVDIVGKVIDIEGNLGIMILGAVDCGDSSSIDYKIYENLVNATHTHKKIFY